MTRNTICIYYTAFVCGVIYERSTIETSTVERSNFENFIFETSIFLIYFSLIKIDLLFCEKRTMEFPWSLLTFICDTTYLRYVENETIENRYDGKRQDDNRRIDFSLIDSGYCNNNRLNNNRLNNNSMKIIIVHPFRMTRSTNHGSSVSLKERKRTNQRL